MWNHGYIQMIFNFLSLWVMSVMILILFVVKYWISYWKASVTFSLPHCSFHKQRLFFYNNSFFMLRGHLRSLCFKFKIGEICDYQNWIFRSTFVWKYVIRDLSSVLMTWYVNIFALISLTWIWHLLYLNCIFGTWVWDSNLILKSNDISSLSQKNRNSMSVFVCYPQFGYIYLPKSNISFNHSELKCSRLQQC